MQMYPLFSILNYYFNMKKILFSIAALSLLTTVSAQQLDRSIRPAAGPAPEIKLADPATFTLDNGLKVFVVENHKLPTISISIQLDIQPAPEGNKAGMSGLVGELITAGTQTRSKDQFDQQVDQIGATLAAGSSSMYGYSLTKFQDQLLDLMSDALLHANFQQSELDKLKKQTLSGLESNKNEPDAMLQNVGAVLNFSKQHPYGEVMTEATVNNIQLADCNAYYKQYFRPNVAYMAIVGDVTVEEAKTLVNKYFGKWESGSVAKASYPTVKLPAHSQLAFVPRDGAVQSVIGIGYPVDLYPGTADVLKTRVVNEILGGSSQGRLFLNLRENHGWTYGSYSNIVTDEIAGHVQLYAKCRNEVTDSSIAEMMHEMNEIRNTPVSDEVLQNALNYMAGKFAIGLENPGTIAQYAINVDRFNMPKDYYKNYLKNLSAITVADVQQTAQKYILPEQAHIVVVGNQDEVVKLKRFSADGSVNYYDNYGNPIEVAETQAADISAQEVLDKYINAIGGKAAIEGLKDLSIVASIKQMGMDLKYVRKVAAPDKLKEIVEFNGQVAQKVVVNGEKGYMEAMGQRKDMTADDLKERTEECDLQADLHPKKYGINYKVLGKETQDGKEVYALEKVSNDGKDRAVQYYDVNSGLLIKEISNTEIQGQTIVSIKSFSDYKEVKNGNGFKTPFSIIDSGTQGMTITIQSAKANSDIKDSEFK